MMNVQVLCVVPYLIPAVPFPMRPKGPPVATWTSPERAVEHCVWWPSPPDAKASASKRLHKHSTNVDGKKILQQVDIENIPIYIPLFQPGFCPRWFIRCRTGWCGYGTSSKETFFNSAIFSAACRTKAGSLRALP